MIVFDLFGKLKTWNKIVILWIEFQKIDTYLTDCSLQYRLNHILQIFHDFQFPLLIV